MKHIVLCLTLSLASWPFGAVQADHVLSQEEALLSVVWEGNGKHAQLSEDDLRALPWETIITGTIWTEQEHSYAGVPATALLEHLGIDNGKLTLVALNDYSIIVPVSDLLADKGAIFAFEQDGDPMSIREKGPLWLIYPFDKDPTYQSQLYYSRSIWQLHHIRVAPE